MKRMIIKKSDIERHNERRPAKRYCIEMVAPATIEMNEWGVRNAFSIFDTCSCQYNIY